MREEDAETEDYINNWQEICYELSELYIYDMH